MKLHESITYCPHCDTLVPESLTANCWDPAHAAAQKRVVCHDCAKYDSQLDEWICPECAAERKKKKVA